jgi:hypothetical protein
MEGLEKKSRNKINKESRFPDIRIMYSQIVKARLRYHVSFSSASAESVGNTSKIKLQ